MNTPTKLAAYGLGLVALFGAAAGAGQAVGPEPDHETGGHTTHDTHRTPTPAQVSLPAGLAVAQDGYALRLDRSVVPAGTPTTFTFTVLGPDGGPLREYVEEHEKELHLVVVRRDFRGYQHVHPERDARGRWSVPLTLTEPGHYKVFADFVPAGAAKGLTLAADLAVPGDFQPRPVPEPARTATVGPYTVTLTGDLVAGQAAKLTLSVRRDGRPVTDLEPYLGAYGHLVALRSGDLGYLHVHPDDAATTAGPDVVFYADVPTAGDYRLFFDFQHGGTVRTAEFTATGGAR